MKNNSVLDTLHVNLWGIPGAQKGSVASELHASLSRFGFSVAIVQEYAKELGWSGQLARIDANGDLVEVDQLIISAEQFRRENMVHGVVQVAITDAPVLAGTLYALEDDEQELSALLRRRTSGWSNLDVLLERNLEESYGSLGRIKNREEAMAMMPQLENLLRKERPDFLRVMTGDAASLIFNEVKRRIKLD